MSFRNLLHNIVFSYYYYEQLIPNGRTLRNIALQNFGVYSIHSGRFDISTDVESPVVMANGVGAKTSPSRGVPVI